MVNIIIIKTKQHEEEHCNDNIKWYSQLTHKVTLYDKCAEQNTLDDSGVFAYTVLQHIIYNYYKLDDVSVFLRENPFQSMYMVAGSTTEITCPYKMKTIITKINNELSDSSPFSSFYQIAYNEPSCKIKCCDNEIDTTDICKRYFQNEQYIFTVVPGCQFIVPKVNILSRPLEFWQNLYNGLFVEKTVPIEIMNQLWYLAYTGTINNEVLGIDYEVERLAQNSGIDYRCSSMPNLTLYPRT